MTCCTEEAQRRGFDKNPSVKNEFSKAFDELLYQAFYNQEINRAIQVADSEILRYYNTQSENYPGGWNESVRLN